MNARQTDGIAAAKLVRCGTASEAAVAKQATKLHSQTPRKPQACDSNETCLQGPPPKTATAKVAFLKTFLFQAVPSDTKSLLGHLFLANAGIGRGTGVISP